jgi:hypothetical protein
MAYFWASMPLATALIQNYSSVSGSDFTGSKFQTETPCIGDSLDFRWLLSLVARENDCPACYALNAVIRTKCRLYSR